MTFFEWITSRLRKRDSWSDMQTTTTTTTTAAPGYTGDHKDMLTPQPFPADLAGWSSDNNKIGWSVTDGVAKYDPNVSGRPESYLWLDRLIDAPMDSGVVVRATVDTEVQGYGAWAVAAVAILNRGTYIGGVAGDQNLIRRPVVAVPTTAGPQLAPGVYASCTQTLPVSFSNFSYSVEKSSAT